MKKLMKDKFSQNRRHVIYKELELGIRDWELAVVS